MKEKVEDIFSIRFFLKLSFQNVRNLYWGALALNLLALATPLIMLQVYDRIIPNQSTGSLFWLILGASVAITFEFVVRFFRDSIAAFVGAKYEHVISNMAFSHVLEMSFRDLESSRIAHRLDQLEAIGTIKGFYSNNLINIFLDIPFGLLFLWIIYKLSQKIFLFIFVSMALFFVAIMLLKFATSRYEALNEIMDNQRTDFIIELISKIHQVKSFSLEESKMKEFEKLQEEQASLDFKTNFVTSVPEDLGFVLSQLILFGVFFFGGPDVIDGKITLGVLTACMTMSSRAVQPIQSAITFWLHRSALELAIEKVKKIFDAKVDNFEKRAIPQHEEIRGKIVLQNVSFSYFGTKGPVVDNLSLTLNPGEMLGLCPSRFLGTTTILNLISGQILPQKGEILMDSYDVSKYEINNLQMTNLAYVPQTAVLFKGTVLENMSNYDHRNNKKAMDIARLFHLDEVFAALPQGFQTRIDRESNLTISRSLIHLVSLIRALMIRPKIMLIDKADTSLDQGSAKVFHDMIEYAKSQCTVVLVTANTEHLALCDKIMQIAENRSLEIVDPRLALRGSNNLLLF